MRKAKDALKSALEGQDIEDIKAKKKNLKSNSRFISKSISTSSTSSNKLKQQAQDGAQQTQNDSNVEDAEFKEVNDVEDKNNC